MMLCVSYDMYDVVSHNYFYYTSVVSCDTTQHATCVQPKTSQLCMHVKCFAKEIKYIFEVLNSMIRRHVPVFDKGEREAFILARVLQARSLLFNNTDLCVAN
jgi:hypothetical protein